MNFNSATVLFFSPTGTTRKIAHAIADGIGVEDTSFVDITQKGARDKLLTEISTDLLIVGYPVYSELAPEIVTEALHAITITQQPAAVFCVYGNVGFGMSLRQITSLLTDRGLPVVACGAFIGEHSFSTDGTPLAKGRPDEQDLERARVYGTSIRDRLLSEESVNGLTPDSVQGTFPLIARIIPKNSAQLLTRPPVINSSCNNCMACRKSCPTGAINDDLSIDASRCIRCFSCVKNCVKHGRNITYRVKPLVNHVLSSWNKKRMQVQTFFA